MKQFIKKLIGKYWHELSDTDIQNLILAKVSYKFILKKFKQPDWCLMADALVGQMGCWSLTDNFNRRHEISPEFCSGCEYFDCDYNLV